MVGVRTWSMAQIMWILREWRRGCKIQELVDQFRTEFPNNQPRCKSLRTGIAYVWDKYNKDPSYNHDFSKAEIAFIMAQKHLVQGNVIKEVLKCFKEAFPYHDWKSYVDELLAIEAAVEKHNRDPQFCVQWQNDEVRFILWNKMRTRSWEELLTAFQIWREREEVTIASLQYLYASRQLERFHRIEVKEGLERHYRQYLNGVKELTFDELKMELKDVEWNMTPYHYGDLPPIVQKLTKRGHEVDGDAESQSKRCHVFPQQLLRVNAKGKQGTMNVNARSESIRRSSNHQTGVSRLVAQHHPRILMSNSRADPRIHSSGSGIQQQITRGDGHKFYSQPAYAQNLGSALATMPISQSNPPDSWTTQTSSPRYPFPNIMPQQIMVDELNQQYLITPIQIAPTGREQSPRGRQSWTSSRGATLPPITAPDWSPSGPWNRINFQSSNYHTGSVSGYRELISNTNWQKPELTSFNGFSRMPSMRENNLRYPNVDDPPMQAVLSQVENMQQPVLAVPAPSGILVAGENEMPFQDVNILPGQAGFNPNGSSSAPGSMIPAGFADTYEMEGSQVAPSDINMESIQPDFTPDENWPDLASVTANDFPCTLGMDGNHTPMSTAPMQTAYMPNRNPPEPIEPNSVLRISRSEDTPNLQSNPGVLSAEALDSLWRTIEEAEYGEFQELLRTGQGHMPYPEEEERFGPLNFTTRGNSQEPDSAAAGDPLCALATGDQQVFEHGEDTCSDQLDLSTADAFQQPGMASGTSRFSSLGMEQHQASHAEGATL